MEREPSKLKLDVWATLVAGGLLCALTFVVADAAVRQWRYIPVARHVVGSLALYVLAGAVLGLVAGGLTELEHFLTSRVARRHPRLGALLRPLFYALLAAWACHQTAEWTFSGERIRGTALARWGPRAFLTLISAAVAASAWLVIRSMTALDKGRRKFALGVGGSFILLSAIVITIDLTVFVALYTRLHTLLETVAALLFTSAAVLLLTGLAQRFDFARRAIRGLALVAVAWCVLVAGITALRGWLDSALRHVWLEEVYVGRVLRRYQTVEAFLRSPRNWRGLAMSRVERLRERYELTSTAQDKGWDVLPDEPADFAARIRGLRGERTDFNIVIYYVDTLRSDYASNPNTMPATVNFFKQAINFQQAYSAGSDTLRALPALTGGNYRFGEPHRNDLLEVAKRSELVSVLFIAQSAHEFLTKLRPSFKFEQTVRIQDYAPERTDVWGYGASAPTAGRIVDEALNWLRSRGSPKHRFMLWLFNFDQHNWRELDERYIATAATKYGLSEAGDPSFRYRVTARAIDAEFERLLRGLDQLGLAQRTIVLFVSDHGEALGRDGFWVHSVFLWEPLVRVPLAIRIPGIAPQEIDEKVSLVDVAPTLARYIEANPPSDGYQGEDLLGYLVPGRPRRRLPLLMAAVAKEQLVRIGMIHPESPYKLVLSLEAAVPELYDLSADDVDGVNVAERESRRLLGMLNALARSPVFPRTANDFGVEPDDSAGPLPCSPLNNPARRGRAATKTLAARERERDSRR